MNTRRSKKSHTARSFRAVTYLSLFGLAITVPLLLLFGALLLQSASAQRATLEARVLQVLDALVTDVDREFDRDITILHTLATSQALANADWRTFYDQAEAGLQGRAYLVLVDANGRQLVNTYVPYGQQPTMTGDPETVRRILQTRTPVVSNLFTSLVVKKPVFNISIPILQGGQVRYVMSLGLLPEDMLTLLKSQRLGPQWVTLIWDANGILLARSKDNARFVGRPMPRNMREQVTPAVVRTSNLDGSDVLHATAHSHFSGWGVGVNVPYSLATEQMRNSLLLWVAVGLLAITVALLSGMFFARQITTPLSVAANAAAAFGRGERFPLAGSRLKEADAFLVTLNTAQQAREELTEELRQSRDWLQTTLGSIGDGVIATDQNGRIIILNGVAQALTGWTQEEARGKPLEQVFVIRNAETGLEVENPVAKVLREERIVGLANHTRLLAKDGRCIPIDDSAAPIYEGGRITGVVLVFRDVTERLKAEEMLRSTNDELRRTVHLMEPVACFMRDLQDRIVYWNPGANELYGFSSAEAIGQMSHSLLQTKFPVPLDQIEAQLRSTGAWNGELVHTHRDGRTLTVASRWTLHKDAAGKPAAILQVNSDITARREAELELARANEDLNQFAFAASHDLQEPLRMITSYSQLLLKGYRGHLDEEAGTCVEFITAGTKRMRELLGDLLAYTQVANDRPETGKAIDFNHVFQMVLVNCKTAIDETGASVTSDRLPTVEGQESHFIQLLQNLISNGLKYGGDRPPRIHVFAERQDGVWRIGVTDNGIGIAPEYQKQIFGVFKRLHGKTIPGTGIGLAICQRVVERYGGKIWVESKENEGATFYFTLPGTEKGAATA